MIAVIDYGAGNIRSVYKALKHIGCECVITRDKDEIMNADGAVLPGVGSFGDTMDTMNSYGIKDTVIEYINSEKPFLGICLGLQLLFPESEESPNVKGLSVFDGTITKIPSGEGLTGTLRRAPAFFISYGKARRYLSISSRGPATCLCFRLPQPDKRQYK